MVQQGTDLSITRVGCLRLVPSTDLADPALDPAELTKLIEEISDEVDRLVRQAPIATKEARTKLEHASWRIPANHDDEGDIELRYREPVRFSVHWPHKNQEHVFFEDHQWEVFDLTFDGFIYTITAGIDEIPDGQSTFDFGREGHRIIRSILEESEMWKLDIVGPTPMWPVFYVALVDDPENFSFGRKLVQDIHAWESLYLLPKDSGVSLDEVISSLRMPAALSYGALWENHCFRRHLDELYLALDGASQGYRQSLDPLSVDPRTWFSRLSANRELARDLSTAYAAYTQVEEARAAVVMAVKRASEEFKKNPLLSDKAAYTAEMVSEDVAWDGRHVLESLRFLADESRNRGIQAATYAGPLIGALIGAGAVGLGFWLGG